MNAQIVHGVLLTAVLVLPTPFDNLIDVFSTTNITNGTYFRVRLVIRLLDETSGASILLSVPPDATETLADALKNSHARGGHLKPFSTAAG